MDRPLRALYICYQSLEDPLVHSQVVAYLEGLAARGHTIHLLTFEPKLSPEREGELDADLGSKGIAWHLLRYHKRLSLPATIYDALAGALVATRLVRRHRLDAVHARSHVPAAMGLIVRRLTGAHLIFDIRGLLAEEYIDRGRWRRGGIPHRITDRVQSSAIGQAAGIVTLTERVRHHLFGSDPPDVAVVIPCCADFDRLAPRDGDGLAVRDELDLGERPVMVYVGKLTRPYLDREMVEFFRSARELEAGLAFLVVTQSPPETILDEFARAEIPNSDFRVTEAAAERVGSYLAEADFAICFCRPTLPLIAASPTKIGEYLTAGLPVVSSPGLGDVGALIADREVGAVVDDFSEAAYAAAARRLQELARDQQAAERCRRVAEEEFSLSEVGVPRYHELYCRVARTSRDEGLLPR